MGAVFLRYTDPRPDAAISHRAPTQHVPAIIAELANFAAFSLHRRYAASGLLAMGNHVHLPLTLADRRPAFMRQGIDSVRFIGAPKYCWVKCVRYIVPADGVLYEFEKAVHFLFKRQERLVRTAKL